MTITTNYDPFGSLQPRKLRSNSTPLTVRRTDTFQALVVVIAVRLAADAFGHSFGTHMRDHLDETLSLSG